MFSRLIDAIKRFASLTYVDDKAVDALIKEVQRALIIADVNISLVKKITQNIRRRIKEKPENFTLRQHVLSVLYDELKKLVGEKYSFQLKPQRILLLGLYGAGKTTTAGKLANYIRKKGLTVALASLDFERPAAQQQLKQLADRLHVSFISGKTREEVIDKILSFPAEVVIVDAPGKNALDEEMQKEVRNIVTKLKPDTVFLVISADTGQVAGKLARSFSKVTVIDGIILTKMDGSAKGGAAVSSVAESGGKIAFLGKGEKLEDLVEYDPHTFITQLLGIPDFKEIVKRLKVAERENEMTFSFFIKGLKESTSLLPQMNLPVKNIDVERKVKIAEAIYNSMTPEERQHPEIVLKNSSRIRRIARGSGTQEEDVRRLLKEYFLMLKLYKEAKHNRGFESRLKQLIKKFGIKLG